VPLLDVSLGIRNYEDMGIGHFWALDQVRLHLVAWRLPDGNILARATFCGTWAVVPGSETPQSFGSVLCPLCSPASTFYSLRQQATACGRLEGVEDFFFPSDAEIRAQPVIVSSQPLAPPVIQEPCRCPFDVLDHNAVCQCPSTGAIAGHLVSRAPMPGCGGVARDKCRKCSLGIPPRPPLCFDAQGTFADLLLPAADQRGTARFSDFVQGFFTRPFGTSSPLFRFEYLLDCQVLWEDSTAAVFGDVFIGPNHCPQRVPSNPSGGSLAGRGLIK